MNKFRSFAKILAAPVFVLALVSCSMFEGRESSQQYGDDTLITSRVKQAFIADPQIKVLQINVETMQGVVQLSGFVDSSRTEQRAVHIAQHAKGVISVKDNIIVRPVSN